MELSLGSYTMVSVSPSLLASSALALAIRILDPSSRMSNVWSKTLSHYTRYCVAYYTLIYRLVLTISCNVISVIRYDMEQLLPTVKVLASLLITAPQAKLATVYQKYSNKKFMKIARYRIINQSCILYTL